MRCVKHRTNAAGDIRLRYETSDGRSTEVCVRAGWGGADHSGRWDMSSRQAAEIAKWRLIRSYAADGRHWHLWENTAGVQHAVCVSPGGDRRRRMTYSESKAIAKDQLRGRR